MRNKIEFVKLNKFDDLEFKNLFLAKLYENPAGSHKIYGVSEQVRRAQSLGYKKFVISSSGNGAIAASLICHKKDLELIVFVSPKSIEQEKLFEILKFKPRIILSSRPISLASYLAKKHGYFNLTPSRDKESQVGYKKIAFEIFEEMGKIDALFVPVSSGITLKGIHQGFKELEIAPNIFACQTETCHEISKEFDQDFQGKKTSIAKAICAKFVPGKDEIIKIIKESGGSGFVISEEEIKKAWEILEKQDIKTSAEGALALAGVRRGLVKGFGLQNKKIVVLLTGKKREEVKEGADLSEFPKVDFIKELEKIL